MSSNQQSAMMKTDAGTCASISVSLLTTSSRLSNHFLLYTPIDLRFRLYSSPIKHHIYAMSHDHVIITDHRYNQVTRQEDIGYSKLLIYPTVFLNSATELTSTT